MLDVLHCVLIDSPEALNIMKEDHIKVIISLLEKHGRDPKVRGRDPHLYAPFQRLSPDREMPSRWVLDACAACRITRKRVHAPNSCHILLDEERAQAGP